MSNIVHNVTRTNDGIRRSFTEILSNRGKVPPPIKLIVCLLQERSQGDNGEAFIGDIPPKFWVGGQECHGRCAMLVKFLKGSLASEMVEIDDEPILISHAPRRLTRHRFTLAPGVPGVMPLRYKRPL
jgi:hypothetical protein